MGLKELPRRLDEAQQHQPVLAVTVATLKKFTEDKSAQLASMMAFWGFFSIFPLMMAAVTVLGYVLPADEDKRVMGHISSYLPLVDAKAVAGLGGNWLALVAGLASALWSGSAVVRTTQEAFNSVWEVPQVERPKLIESIRRSLAAMVALGGGLIASTYLIGTVDGGDAVVDLGPLGSVLGLAAAVVVDMALFLLAFRMLTDRSITVRDVLPGALLAGGMFWVLQNLSSVIISRHLSGASTTYGNFATVVTILWWFYLQAQLTLLGAQLNVVLRRHYHPRRLVDPPSTEADHRVLRDYAKERRLEEEQHIDSTITDDPDADPRKASPPAPDREADEESRCSCVDKP